MTRVLILSLIAAAPAWSAEQPNVVFVMVDDMGFADAGCYGSKVVKTPNIDRLCRDGMKFTNAYSGCTVCAPARSTLMTGHHMGHTSVRSNAGGVPLLDRDITLAEILKKAGYVTGGFGKWGLGDINTTGAAEKQGFDEFFGYYHQIHAHDFYPDYLIDSGRKLPLKGNHNDAPPKKGGVDTTDPRSNSKRQFAQYEIFGRMKSFIRKNKDRPFFCYAPWTPPHARYTIPADDPAWKLYRNKSWPVNAKVHAAFISMIDRQLGETMQLLKELKIDRKTVVFFCSDNGASNRFEGSLNSSGKLRGFKRSMYEGGIRTPLIAHWPGRIAAGTTTDHICYFPDVLPTLAELCSASAPKGIDGLSFAPTLLGKSNDQKSHPYLYWEYSRMRWGKKPVMQNEKRMAAIRMGKWKAVRQTLDAPVELYDLSQDIGETKNLAAEHPQILTRMAGLFKAAHKPARPQPEPKHPPGRKFN